MPRGSCGWPCWSACVGEKSMPWDPGEGYVTEGLLLTIWEAACLKSEFSGSSTAWWKRFCCGINCDRGVWYSSRSLWSVVALGDKGPSIRVLVPSVELELKELRGVRLSDALSMMASALNLRASWLSRRAWSSPSLALMRWPIHLQLAIIITWRDAKAHGMFSELPDFGSFFSLWGLWLLSNRLPPSALIQLNRGVRTTTSLSFFWRLSLFWRRSLCSW